MVTSKRVMAILASIIATGLSVSGCGSSSGNPDAKSPDANSKVTLTYLHRLPDGDGMTPVNDIIKKWNAEHPNIQVKATKFNGKSSEMIKKLETDVKADDAPDIAQVGYSELPEMYTKGLLQDVTSEASAYKGDFAEGPYKLMQVNGKTYGLPQDTGPLVYYYNQAEFKKLGIPVPTTQNELIENAKKAAAQGKYIMTYQPDEAGMAMSGLAGASGSWYTIKNDAWVVNTNTSGSKAVANVYQQLLDAKAVTTNPRWDPSFEANLKNGSIIGTVGAAWEAPLLMTSMADAKDASGNWRVAQIGNWFGNAGKTGPDGGSGVAVLKGTKHKAEAVKFLDWFNTQVDDLTSQGLVVATTKQDATTPQSWSKFFGGQDIMKEFKTANADMGDFTYMPGFSSVTTAMTDAADKAAKGSGKVADIFSSAQNTSIATLKDYNLAVKE